MKKLDVFDFSGYATKNDLKCKDGRTIKKDAFKENDGTKVPLVWTHLHGEPANILGHAYLENREDGVYAYGVFNDTDDGVRAKKLVQHGDIVALSIYANDLVQKNSFVLHGVIREVSLVLTGANPGAVIENVNVYHSDDGRDEQLDDEAVITMYSDDEENIVVPKASVKKNEPVKQQKVIQHADDGEASSAEGDQTVDQVIESMKPIQKNVMYALIAKAVEEYSSKNGETVEHSGSKEGVKGPMKENVFDKSEEEVASKSKKRVQLTREQWETIRHDAESMGSLRKSFLAHAGTYGIDNISLLFPDAQAVQAEPELYSRDMAWVAGVLSGTKHSPFSRIKTSYADVTADNARAKGYVTGAEKHDEVFGLLGRSTTPTTVYKKQKLDRDDVIDITDLDVVSWMKSEMRVMLDEELARAVLVGDGRLIADEDKIAEDHIRPIWTDADMYAHHIQVELADTVEDVIDHITGARQFYKGSGNPVMYVDPAYLTQMLLLKDSLGYRIYKTEAELAAALRVSRIIEVPVMSGLHRDIAGPVHLHLRAIITNLRDYTLGADKGGQVNLFDDFDIDFNQYKYLLETRCSGALTKLKSALVIEQVVAD